jgi:hypothetical protein
VYDGGGEFDVDSVDRSLCRVWEQDGKVEENVVVFSATFLQKQRIGSYC